MCFLQDEQFLRWCFQRADIKRAYKNFLILQPLRIQVSFAKKNKRIRICTYRHRDTFDIVSQVSLAPPSMAAHDDMLQS